MAKTITIGKKTWTIETPDDRHVRRGKRGQLYMEDVERRFRDYFKAVLDHNRLSIRAIMRRARMGYAKVDGYLISQTEHIPIPVFDLLMHSMDISLRELLVPMEFGPTAVQEPDLRTSSLEQHLRNAVRELNMLEAYIDYHFPVGATHHYLRRKSFQMSEELAAICDLYGLARREEDAPEGLPDWQAEDISPKISESS